MLRAHLLQEPLWRRKGSGESALVGRWRRASGCKWPVSQSPPTPLAPFVTLNFANWTARPAPLPPVTPAGTCRAGPARQQVPAGWLAPLESNRFDHYAALTRTIHLRSAGRWLYYSRHLLRVVLTGTRGLPARCSDLLPEELSSAAELAVRSLQSLQSLQSIPPAARPAAHQSIHPSVRPPIHPSIWPAKEASVSVSLRAVGQRRRSFAARLPVAALPVYDRDSNRIESNRKARAESASGAHQIARLSRFPRFWQIELAARGRRAGWQASESRRSRRRPV